MVLRNMMAKEAPGIAYENYSTPAWCVRRLLEVAPWRDYTTWPRAPRILEPCAGEGAIVRVLRAWYPTAEIDAYELRNDESLGAALMNAGATFAAWSTDALNGLCWRQARDLTLTNPPFSLWQDFAANGIDKSRWCALLLRLGALAHLGELPTPSVYVLPDRPNFVALWKCTGGGEWGEKWESPAEYVVERTVHTSPCGWQEYRSPHESTRGQRCPQCGGKVQRTSSDSSEYAWFVWGPQVPCVHVLAKTSLEERKQ